MTSCRILAIWRQARSPRLRSCTKTGSSASGRFSRRMRASTAGSSPPCLTTGIYCRPSCPVVPPKPENMRFFPSAAAAQQGGFRACKRCRPDASPGSPEWDVRADVVARAMRLIADGVMDDGGVPGPGPPARLQRPPGRAAAGGRARRRPAGAGPRPARADRAAADRDHRAADGRRRLRGRDSPASALQRHGAGTCSRSSPTQLRDRAGRGRPTPPPAACPLRLPFRTPLQPDNLFGHLAATAVPGVEEWRDGAYRRTLRLPHGHGIVDTAAGPRSRRAAS